jgi:hypothetical protein
MLIGAPAYASTYTLQDGNSSILVGDSSGPQLWRVDGEIQLYEQAFFYRVGGAGGESAVHTLPLLNSSQTSPSTLTMEYGNSQLSFEIVYSVLGGAAGTGTAGFSEQVKISNLTANALDVHFFKYADFDLAGNYLGDTAQLGKNLQGLFNEAIQAEGIIQFAETAITPGASHAEIGLDKSVIYKLIDGNPTTLSDNAGPASGDVSWAVQWDRVIAGGGSFIVDIGHTVYVTPIPEPSTAMLVPIGLALLAYARRRSGRA